MILECGPSTIIAIAIGRIVVVTIACWIVGTIVVVVTANIREIRGIHIAIVTNVAIPRRPFSLLQ